VQLLHAISDEEAWRTFLDAEAESQRFGREARAAREQHEADPRAAVHAYRGEYLANFPAASEIRWHRARITAAELAEVRYIDWDYWLEVTNGTRLPRDTENRDEYRELAGHAASFAELILVARDEASYLVVLEGHVRLTALMLDPPDELDVIVGFSDRLAAWTLY
jgi:hypothetical protein